MGKKGQGLTQPERRTKQAWMSGPSVMKTTAYLTEEAALVGDEHTAFDVGDQYPHGYASYHFTRRAVKLLEG
jgi:hypothetical protein